MQEQRQLPDVPRWIIIGALWVWFAVLLATHYGARSPYSYAGGVVGGGALLINGLAVNSDAITVEPVTRFFYEGTRVDYRKAHNLKLPMHSALTAIVASFLRSYMLANYIVNLLTLWLLAVVVVRMADSFEWPRAATLLAALTCAALPTYAHFIGQPMHYIVGVAANFAVIMLAIANARAGVRSPVRFGLLTALLLLGYDPYVFIAALATWLVLVQRYRLRELVVYASVALVPFAVWRAFLRMISDATVSTDLQRQIVGVPLGWWHILTHLDERQVVPFVAGHIGVTMAVHMMLALIYWPVLLVCVAGLFVVRGEIRPVPTTWLVTAIAALFFVAQLVTAAFDPESNPRRALPLLFAASFAYFFVVGKLVVRRPWRIAFTIVLLSSIFLTMADALVRNPVVGYIHTNEAMRDRTKKAFEVADEILSPEFLPQLVLDEAKPDWWNMAAARLEQPAIFAFANLYVLGLLFALLYMLRERALVPRPVPLFFAGGALLSFIVRFAGV